jgi:iron(III) transport system substrate-binding protein
MVRGEISIGVLLYNIAYIKKRDGAPVDIIFPSDGVPLNYYAAGVTKTAANPNAAKLFLNLEHVRRGTGVPHQGARLPYGAEEAAVQSARL